MWQRLPTSTTFHLSSDAIVMYSLGSDVELP
jgi:hypothetical protein